MRFSVLASGSTGNAIYIENDDHAFLVDAGLSGRKMEELLALNIVISALCPFFNMPILFSLKVLAGTVVTLLIQSFKEIPRAIILFIVTGRL